jgi:hypothetical protein
MTLKLIGGVGALHDFEFPAAFALEFGLHPTSLATLGEQQAEPCESLVDRREH